MNRALPFLAAVVHIAAGIWLVLQASRLWDMLMRGDVGAGLVLALGTALVMFGARTSGAVLLLLAARLLALVSTSAGRRFGRLAITVSPAHLRKSLAGSAAGLAVLGSAAWSPAVAASPQSEAGSATAAHSPAWASPGDQVPGTARSPAWATAEPSASHPEQSPGWPANRPGPPPREESPAWPVSESLAPGPAPSPGWPAEGAAPGDADHADLPRPETPPDAPGQPPPEESSASGAAGSSAANPETEPESQPGPESPPAQEPQWESDAVVVAQGDTLWSIAADLHPTADAETLAGAAAHLYRSNQDLIGPDPHLIIPGMRLETP
jgi:resuscitation-promoting factor RpfA